LDPSVDREGSRGSDDCCRLAAVGGIDAVVHSFYISANEALLALMHIKYADQSVAGAQP
jgi:hypothetical protein